MWFCFFFVLCFLHLYQVLRCTRAHGKWGFLKTRMTTEVREVFFCLMALIGGVKRAHHADSRILWHKKCGGGNRLKLQAGGDGRGTGGASDGSVHRLTCFCVLTHPRDRWEIKRRRKERMNSKFWSARSSYCTFLCGGKVQ